MGCALVDELGAALQVQAELAWALRGDARRLDQRSRAGAADEPEDREVAAAAAHASVQLRREDEQQAAVLVVRGEDVCLGGLGPVALGVHDHRLVEHAHAPLERRADVVVAVLELEPEDLPHRAADHVEVAEAGELRAPRPAPISRALLVADEEGGVRRRVVVVEQLEQEAEAALLARLRRGSGSRRSVPSEVLRSPQFGQMKMGMTFVG